MFDRNPKSLYSLILTFVVLTLNVKTYAQNTWQQEINYQINVKLDDEQHFLHGDISIVYHNNSPQTLNELWMHVFPNAYKTTKSAFAIQKLEDNSTKFQFAMEEERGYMDSLNFLIDGLRVGVISDEKYPDILKLILPKGLAPGQSIQITSPFRVKLPYTFSRMGHVKQSYQISQWYPKPAVFDRKGWHPIPYLDQGEFYSDYGSFDVKITLPKNYVVGATGELQTNSEVAFLDSLSKVTNALKEFPEDDDFPESSKEYKTLHYKQNKIHDFAWFADKRFHVLASEVTLPESKRVVKTCVMFSNKYAEYWKDASKYINDAVYYYSLWNGDYPYNFCTAIDGALSAGGGMEYPMITVIGEVESGKTLDRVIAHEVGHNWFYGILGSNEREHPWMDEGVNSFYEQRYMRMKYEDGYMIPASIRNPYTYFFGLDYFPSGYENYLLYKLTSSCGKAQPININAEQYTGLNYGAVVYTKTALALRYLEQYLGVEKYDSIMHIYFNTWKFRHPYPEDMKAVFEQETGENLSWFFDELINAKNDPEFKLASVKKIKEELQVKVSNTSGVPGPVFVSAYDKNNKLIETQKTGAFVESAYLYFDKKDVKKIVVDPLYVIPESNRNNNTISLKSPLKKVEPLHLQLLGGVTRPDRTNLFFMPVAGYNQADGFMPGLALYNNVFPFKNVEWTILPMYGMRSEKLNGTGSINIYNYPKRFSEVNTSINFNIFSLYNESNNYLGIQYYERFTKYAIGTSFTLNPESSRSKIKRKVSYRLIYTNENLEKTTKDNFSTIKDISNKPNYYLQLRYEKENSRFINPYKFNVMYEYANNFLNNDNAYEIDGLVFNNNRQHHKFSMVYKQKINYRHSKKGVQFRLFAGTIFTNTDSYAQANFFSVSGNNDYTYDKAFFNRREVNYQQFHELDGGFKTNTYTSTTKNLLSLNIKAPFKTKLPIGLFADAALATDKFKSGWGNAYADFGVYMPLVSDVIEVYFPVFNSEGLNNTNKYSEQIRFILDFQAIQPLGVLRKLQIM